MESDGFYVHVLRYDEWTIDWFYFTAHAGSTNHPLFAAGPANFALLYRGYRLLSSDNIFL